MSNDDAGDASRSEINIPNRPQLDSGTSSSSGRRHRRKPGDGRSPDLVGADYVIQLVQGEIDPVQVGRIRLHAAGRRSPAVVADVLLSGRGHDPDHRRGARQHEEVRVRRRRRHGIARSTLRRRRSTARTAATTSRPAGAGLYPYEVKVTPPTLVVKSLKPTPAKPTAGHAVHAAARRGAVGHRRRRAERPGRRASGASGSARLKAQVQRVLGGAAVCTWNIPAEREGQDLPWIGRGRVRRAEGARRVTQGRFASTAACATPSAPRLPPRSSSPLPGRPPARSTGRRGASSSRRLTKVRPGARPHGVHAESQQPRAGHHDPGRPAAGGRDVSPAGSPGSVRGAS